MRIAIMGTRGVPACYGGFETFAEELGSRLVSKGHEVIVYGRSNIIQYKEKYYKGMRLVILPTLSHKYLDTVVHTFISMIDSLFRNFDVILLCNAANSIFSFIPRLRGVKIVVNVDGIERLRTKWNAVGKLWYRLGELCSCFFPNAIVSDARVIYRYYKETYGKDSIFIPYGADIQQVETRETLDRYGLEPRRYFLYVSRMEPENNGHLVVHAFEKVITEYKLVMVGDAPYNKEYIDNLKKTKDQRIIFTGFIFGKGYKELGSNAFCYIQATSVGGTHPALIESMGMGNCVIANDTPEHREVAGDAAVYFEKNSEESLREMLQKAVDNELSIEELRQKARKKIADEYTWDAVTKSYDKLFNDLLNGKKPQIIQ